MVSLRLLAPLYVRHCHLDDPFQSVGGIILRLRVDAEFGMRNVVAVRSASSLWHEGWNPLGGPLGKGDLLGASERPTSFPRSAADPTSQSISASPETLSGPLLWHPKITSHICYYLRMTFPITQDIRCRGFSGWIFFV